MIGIISGLLTVNLGAFCFWNLSERHPMLAVMAMIIADVIGLTIIKARCDYENHR